MSVVFLNGQFLPRSEAFIPIDDRGFLFGHGVFTTIKVVDGVLENYFEHDIRLTGHAAELKIESPQIDIEIFRELLKRNNAFEGTWRLKIVLTGGGSELRKMVSTPPGQTLITIEKQNQLPRDECRLMNYPWPITGPTSTHKTLSYINRLCIADFATSNGVDDALVLSPEGWILETAFANIFWRIKDKLYTPDAILPYLKGVSIELVEKCAKKLKCQCHSSIIKPADLPDNAQIYLTNSMIGIVPVVSDGERAFHRDTTFEKQLKEVYKSEMEQASLRLNVQPSPNGT